MAGAYGPAVAPPNDSQSTLALVLGILGIVCCPILGPVALFIGNGSRQRIQASGGTVGGGGMATAGFILGIIGTVYLALWVIGVVLYVIGAIASRATTG